MIRTLDYGPDAVLIECPDEASRAALFAALGQAHPPEIAELVPGACTILVTGAPGVPRAALVAVITQRWMSLRELNDAETAASDEAGDRPTEPIPVACCYDGDDLTAVANHVDLSVDQLIEWHSGQLWQCQFTGFTPGFGYLKATQQARSVPRLATPRTRVPAGAVGLADEFSGIYPRPSPGGWQLIGRTNLTLWDPQASMPARITAGVLVRFEPVAELPAPAIRGSQGSPGRPTFEVLDPGLLTLIEDAGRPGFRQWGVPRGGAADLAALRLANRLVGNPEDAPGLEIIGALQLRAARTVLISLTGAVGAATVNRDPVSPFTPFLVPEGAVLTLGPPAVGLRTYLAVAGGVSAQVELGSLGSSPSVGLGPTPVRAGDVLTASEPPAAGTAIPGGTELAPTQAPRAGTHLLRIWPGPRRDWFTPQAWEQLLAQTWTVTPAVDRVGVRLEGAPLARVRAGELPSEPMLAGAVQVPSSGEPVIFGVDHPTTGGYPVIAVVASDDLSRLGQCRPGDHVRFRPATGS